MIRSQLSKAVRIIASTLDSLEQHELEALVAGKGKLVYVAADKSTSPLPAPLPDMESTVARLRTCKDREEARDILSQVTNKNQLTSLAKTMKIHVMKHDRRENIEHKIIEFAIGGRLRSEAIQTLNLKGGGGYTGGA